jgi:3-phosphoshikimate 1-carboxyvinyltransferase
VSHIDLRPIRYARGSIRLPGSKSISNRTLLLAALAQGDTRVHEVLDSDDTRYMLEALRSLGIQIAVESANTLIVRGAAAGFPVKSADLFLGNAGTAFRPLTAVLALLGGEYRLSGVERMHERPIRDLVDALRRIGARVDYAAHDGFPPLLIHPGAIELDAPVRVRGSVSSQFVTALLMALPLTGRPCTLEIEGELISKPYVEITLNTMRRFGVNVRREGWARFHIPPERYRSPGEIFVEGDASSASYFLAAGAISGLSGGGPVRVEGIGRGSIQGDVRFAEVLERLGAGVARGDNWIEAGAGTPRLRRFKAFDVDFNAMPDAAMTAGIAALFADGACVLRNIGSWRVKETDRITAMAAELRKLGAQVEAGDDYLKVAAPADRLNAHAAIDTYDDHRMAMCFSLVALGGVPVRINDPECVGKTFPRYFDALASISTDSP